MVDQTKPAAAAPSELDRVAALLGGPRILRRQPESALDAHELILKGLPARALSHLMGELIVLEPTTSLGKAIGMSLRTYQRHSGGKTRPLSAEQSSRTWKFAEILAKATTIFGTQAEAEAWLQRPAIGLDQRRPIDLLSTPAGVELVEDHLQRLEYGVYA